MSAVRLVNQNKIEPQEMLQLWEAVFCDETLEPSIDLAGARAKGIFGTEYKKAISATMRLGAFEKTFIGEQGFSDWVRQERGVAFVHEALLRVLGSETLVVDDEGDLVFERASVIQAALHPAKTND